MDASTYMHVGYGGPCAIVAAFSHYCIGLHAYRILDMKLWSPFIGGKYSCAKGLRLY